MSYESRAYDEPGRDGFGPDPVVVLVVSGTHDVSRLVGLFAHGTIEQIEVGKRIQAQVRRDEGGRAALRLLADHGGPDFLPPQRLEHALAGRPLEVLRRMLAGQLQKQIAADLGVSRTGIANSMHRARELVGAVSNDQLMAWAVFYGLLVPDMAVAGAR
jgi:DNA-binding CsgD family transcriptional regulator